MLILFSQPKMFMLPTLEAFLPFCNLFPMKFNGNIKQVRIFLPKNKSRILLIFIKISQNKKWMKLSTLKISTIFLSLHSIRWWWSILKVFIIWSLSEFKSIWQKGKNKNWIFKMMPKMLKKEIIFRKMNDLSSCAQFFFFE